MRKEAFVAPEKAACHISTLPLVMSLGDQVALWVMSAQGSEKEENACIKK